MQIEITNKFRKQVEKLNNQKVNLNLYNIFTQISAANKLSEIKNLKKLKGYKDYYRMRLGDYRIGIQVKEKTIILAAFDHRSDIYKYFP